MPKYSMSRSPLSTESNLIQTATEVKCLEAPREEGPYYVYSRTLNPKAAPDQPEYITVDFERGDAVAVNGEGLSPASLLARLNELGRPHGLGRLDLVENRFVGMKSRGMYETPGGPILHHAPRAGGQLQLSRGEDCRARVWRGNGGEVKVGPE